MTFIIGAVSLPDALDNKSLEWTSDGAVPWTGGVITTHDGLDAAQSGAIGNNQQSRLVTTVPGPGTLSFWWKVSLRNQLRFAPLPRRRRRNQPHLGRS